MKTCSVCGASMLHDLPHPASCPGRRVDPEDIGVCRMDGKLYGHFVCVRPVAPHREREPLD